MVAREVVKVVVKVEVGDEGDYESDDEGLILKG